MSSSANIQGAAICRLTTIRIRTDATTIPASHAGTEDRLRPRDMSMLGVVKAGCELFVGFDTESSAQVFVRLHVEPHREQRELAARDQEQCDEDDRRGRDVVPADAL